jgi:L-iditol 2-dehydrogenase
MLAVTVTPGGSPALRELPSPIAPPGGILVRVRACGLCGSDVEKLRPGGAAAGSVLGHEIAGEVIDGALPAGMRIALAHHVPCGECGFCLAGHEPLCPAYVASTLEPGGFCELTAASQAHVAQAALPLPDHVSDISGSFVEPLACVLRGIEGLSGDALVTGAGSIGLLAAQALRARGAHVRVLEPEPSRARRAAELGFEPPAEGERFAGALLSAADAFSDALPLLEPGGQLVLFSGGV